MSILVLQSSWWGRESLLLCLICLPCVSWWLSGSSSTCHGVVCGLWLWYFLIILTYYFSLSIRNNAKKKTDEFDLNYVITDTSSHSDILKWVDLAIWFYFDTQVGVGQDKLPWTVCPHPVQLCIRNNVTKKTSEFDLNYVYDWYIFTFRYFKIRRISKIILLRYPGG